MDFGGIFGAVGSIVGSAMQANAIKKATQMQVDALREQRQWVYDQLDPAKISSLATEQDYQTAQNRLAIQSQIDPQLLANRYAAEDKQAAQLASIGTGAPAEVSAQAAKEALAGGNVAQQGKQALIDAAMKQLSLGATLPSDVQAELVRAGLEKSGMTVGSTAPQGMGGQNARTIIGQAGIALQQQRQQQAAGLLQSAQGLETSRANILGQLFPNLTAQQLNNTTATSGVLSQSNALAPPGGLSGTDVANLWLSRVGSASKLDQQAAAIAASGAQGAAAAWQPTIGYLGQAAGSVASGWANSSQTPTSGFNNAQGNFVG